MDNERNKVTYITAFLKDFATIFTLIVLSLSITGKFIAGFYPELQMFSTILVLEGAGLPYSAILQSVLFATIMSAVDKILSSGIIKTKLSFFWRYLIFFLVTFITTLIFSYFFKWFPLNNFRFWLVFLLFFFTFYFIAFGFLLLLLKINDKKYNKFIENYKKGYK